METPQRRTAHDRGDERAPGEGKTTASINLALVTALSVGARVLSDRLRSAPAARAQRARTAPEGGLAEVLTGDVKSRTRSARRGRELDVLARARPARESLRAARLAGMHELIAEVASRYDRVILDTAGRARPARREGGR
jgi:Mrp family chromosome partitioning ATPase